MVVNVNSLKEFILANYSQIELFSKYLDIPQGDILNCIHNNKRVINKHRGEENSSLTFTYQNGKLRMWDYGSTSYRGDIFDLVGLIVGMNPANKKGFVNICKYIINNEEVKYVGLQNNTKQTATETIIRFEPRNWEKDDIKFWMVGIHTNISKLTSEGVYPVREATIIKETIHKYYHKDSDPCYAYFFDSFDKKNLIKLYFPRRNKHSVRFITNNSNTLEGINALYKTDNLVITKGFKERVILRHYLPDNYCVTNFSSEGARLSNEQMLALRSIYKRIFINTDLDTAGITNAYYHYLRFKNASNEKDKIYPVFINNAIFKINKNNEVQGLYNSLSKTIQTLTIDDLIERLNEFIEEFMGEYEYKDFFDLSYIVSPTVLKEYIYTKFKVS